MKKILGEETQKILTKKRCKKFEAQTKNVKITGGQVGSAADKTWKAVTAGVGAALSKLEKNAFVSKKMQLHVCKSCRY